MLNINLCWKLYETKLLNLISLRTVLAKSLQDRILSGPDQINIIETLSPKTKAFRFELQNQ